MADGKGFGEGAENVRASLPLRRFGRSLAILSVASLVLACVTDEARAFHRHRYVCPPVVHRHHVYRAPVYRSHHYCPPVYRHYHPHTFHYRAPSYCPPVRHYYPPAVRYRYSVPYCYPGYGYSYSYNYGYPIRWTTSLPIGGFVLPVGGFGGGAVRNDGTIDLLSRVSDLGTELYSANRPGSLSRPAPASPAYDDRREDYRRDEYAGTEFGNGAQPAAALVPGQGIFGPGETQTVVDLVSRVAESVREARATREARGGTTAGTADRDSGTPRRPLLAAAARALAGTARGGQVAQELPVSPRTTEPTPEGSADRTLPAIPARPPVPRQPGPTSPEPQQPQTEQPELPEPSVDRAPFESSNGVPQASSDSARRRAAKYIEQGDQLFARGRYLEAMSVYQRAAASTPDSAQPLIRQGLAYVAAKRYERAADVIRRGLRLEPDYAASGFRLRHLYGGDTGAKNQHLEALAAAANDDPANADLPLLAAIFLHYDGQVDRAATFFAESQQRNGETAQFVALFR
jgi:hypothetical protein